MAIITDTQLTYNSRGNREDLHDMISLISPSETPLYSMLGDKPVKATKSEWQVDALRAPTATNARVEGDQYAYVAATATSRVGNFCQIFIAEQIVSKTQEVVDKAGRKSEIAYQKAKMGQEIKTDMEASMLSNNASVAGNSSTPRRMGGLRAWLATNDSLGATGASGGYNAGTGVVDAATNGDQRAFTKALLDDTIQGAYVSGGSPDVLMVSPYVKRVFSTFMSDANVAQQRYQAKATSQSTIVGAADAYLSDFGLIDVVPNRQMARVGAALSRNAFLIDRSKIHKGFLRKIQQDKGVAPNMDGDAIVLVGEGTLVVDNEAAHGVVADLFGLSAAA